MGKQIKVESCLAYESFMKAFVGQDKGNVNCHPYSVLHENRIGQVAEEDETEQLREDEGWFGSLLSDGSWQWGNEWVAVSYVAMGNGVFGGR
ncbi:hypothetical protein V6N13_063663 [Hibiscus sabdariffa]